MEKGITHFNGWNLIDQDFYYKGHRFEVWRRGVQYLVHFTDLNYTPGKGYNVLELDVLEAERRVLNKARKHFNGVRRYNCRAYGGGVTFTSFNLANDLIRWFELMQEEGL